jgi:hypothetical protein
MTLSRNLHEHPITFEEVYDYLGDVYQREVDDDRIGGQEATILKGIMQIVEDHFRSRYFNPTKETDGS